MDHANRMKRMYSRQLCKALLFPALLLMATTNCFASSVTLQWDAATAPDLAGYKVYYSSVSAPPLTGTGASEGVSPIDVSTQTTTTITGLDPAQSYYFAVTAYDSAGVESEYSNIVPLSELISPSVFIDSPVNGDSASGIVSVAASASDNVAVTRLEFYVNGALAATDSAPPYLYSWNTSALASGSYTLSATAYDASGNAGHSEPVSVTVLNDLRPPLVALAGPASGATVHGTVPVSLQASDDVGVTRLELYANGTLILTGNLSPCSYNWDTTGVANGAYYLLAKAYDAAGNLGQSATLPVSVLNDTVAPKVAITAPFDGSKVAGVVTVTAQASDNVGVSKVEFYLNGVLRGTVSSAPYGFNLLTAYLPNGTYALSAKAYDAAGHVSQSAPVTVTVGSDLAAPVVNSFSMPAISNSATVAITSFLATDDVGVVGYLVSESWITPAPSAAGWSPTPQTRFTFAGSGARKVYAWVKDAAGRVSACKAAAVLVDNALPSIRSFSVSGQDSWQTITASATDNTAIDKLLLYVDNALALETRNSAFSYPWKVLYTGTHRIVLKAYDTAGNEKVLTAYVNR